ncbi:type III pantothenate kinase [Azonexus sp.]|jgi:type III pantothenate kinase|uniref:type III pantothenate kinase n=1 Tax=Azonexus sp. TaxID=1872668 RepID=UPI002839B990|nr:type III pantothenate kinase [Azonexus sp.]MDR1994652.1 type III pantothenate kinase [Azonexus sp.]
MIVCLDSGNSRLKWGVHDGHAWLEQGAAEHDDATALAALVGRWPRPRHLLLANVAGTAAAARIRERLGAWAPLLQEIRSGECCAGVTNHYRQPERLGVDRWCALLGARARTKTPCLVVMAGTATTIDSLDGDGNFLGGLILPGSDLMRRALANDTADLPLACGDWSATPRCTEDAIASGVLEAQLGAIERAFARLAASAAICLLSGGNAGVLRPHLGIPCIETPNLPLDGLLRIAQERGSAP